MKLPQSVEPPKSAQVPATVLEREVCLRATVLTRLQDCHGTQNAALKAQIATLERNLKANKDFVAVWACSFDGNHDTASLLFHPQRVKVEVGKASEQYHHQIRTMHEDHKRVLKAYKDRAVIVGQQLIDLEAERDTARQQLYVIAAAFQRIINDDIPHSADKDREWSDLVATLEAQLEDLRSAAASRTPPSAGSNFKAKEAHLKQQTAQLQEEQRALQLDRLALQQRYATSVDTLGVLSGCHTRLLLHQGSITRCR